MMLQQGLGDTSAINWGNILTTSINRGWDLVSSRWGNPSVAPGTSISTPNLNVSRQPDGYPVLGAPVQSSANAAVGLAIAGVAVVAVFVLLKGRN